jgi:hypothetical protein
MSRAISNSQKKIIFNSIPSTITIDETDITASKIWSNQAVTSYPTIDLNISNDGVQTGIRDVSDGVLYYQATLTIHIYTQNLDGFNGARIAEHFAADICSEIESWITPLTGDVRIFNPDSDINSIGNNGYEDEIFDYVLSITLYHS